MSSAMMTRILGFCGCCARAGIFAVVATAAKASRPGRMFLRKPIRRSSVRNAGRHSFERTSSSSGKFKLDVIVHAGNQPADPGMGLKMILVRDRVFFSARGRQNMAPASDEGCRDRLVARGTSVRLLDLLQDPTEVVALGSLQRRVFFVTQQMS